MSVFGKIAGSVLAGGLNFGSSVSQYYTAKESQKNQQAYDTAMWNAQNAYNDPSAQMQRLKNAGLNPNLVYGNGANVGNANNFPKSSVMEGTDFGLSKVGDAVGDYFNYRQRKEEKDIANAIALANQRRQEQTHEANLKNIDAQTEYYRSLAQKNSVAGKFTPIPKEKNFYEKYIAKPLEKFAGGVGYGVGRGVGNSISDYAYSKW